MDFFSTVASIVTILNASLKVYNATRQLANRQQHELLARNYGAFFASVVAWLSPETASQYELIYYYILRGSKEEATNFRQAVTNECNMTAIAGAIIAQVAITALSLPFLSNTHWTARACFLIAVTSGCLSVYYACVLQRRVGKLYSAEQIKEWLLVPDPETGTEEGTRGIQDVSLAAIFSLSAPFVLVKVSIFSFLVGLAIYQGFIFSKNLDNSAAPGNSRDSFIALMVGTGFCTVFFWITFIAKDVESMIRSRFSRLSLSSPHNMFDVVPESSEAEAEASLKKPCGTTLQHFSTIQQQESVHEGEPANEQQRVKNPQAQALASLLEAAARAHAQCAEADRHVAMAFSGLSTTSHAG